MRGRTKKKFLFCLIGFLTQTMHVVWEQLLESSQDYHHKEVREGIRNMTGGAVVTPEPAAAMSK
jgi:hypothetical protein